MLGGTDDYRLSLFPALTHHSALSPQPLTSSGAITSVRGQTEASRITSLTMSVNGTNSQATSIAITHAALFMALRERRAVNLREWCNIVGYVPMVTRPTTLKDIPLKAYCSP